jgi:hypothetical protein
MNLFDTSRSASAQWLVFLVFLLAIGLGITGFVLWFFVLRKTGGKRRRRRKHHGHRRLNPTRAEQGGLPPLRDPGEPPRGV